MTKTFLQNDTQMKNVYLNFFNGKPAKFFQQFRANSRNREESRQGEILAFLGP